MLFAVIIPFTFFLFWQLALFRDYRDAGFFSLTFLLKQEEYLNISSTRLLAQSSLNASSDEEESSLHGS
jgi:hypothetical protein